MVLNIACTTLHAKYDSMTPCRMEQAEEALTSLEDKTTSWCGKEEDDGGLAQLREGGGGGCKGWEGSAPVQEWSGELFQ